MSTEKKKWEQRRDDFIDRMVAGKIRKDGARQGANWAKKDILLNLPTKLLVLVESILSMKESYGEDSNGIHQAVYEALDALDGLPVEQPVVTTGEVLQALQDTTYWLRRMKDLKWDDPEYAPKFKACMEKNEKLLENYYKRAPYE